MRTNHCSWSALPSPTWIAATIAVLMLAVATRAEVPPTSLRVSKPLTDPEGLQILQFDWDAVPGASYQVQRLDNLSSGAAWQTVNRVISTNAGPVRWTTPESLNEGYYRLVLPQPEISAVEPAIFAPGVVVNASVIGQCFETNDVVRLNGVVLGSVIYVTGGLLECSFPPQSAGPHLVELVHGGVVRSSFSVMCADAIANPELVLQGPPQLPLSAPLRLHPKLYQAEVDPFAAGRIGKNTRGGIALFDGSNRSIKNGGTSGTGPNGQGLRVIGDEGTDCDDNDPKVCLWSGEVQQQVVDLVVPGRGLDFVWGRTFRSRTGHLVTFDDRWTFSYDVHCAQNGTGGMDVYDGTGRKDTFKVDTNGVFTCPEFFREGTLSNTVFRLTFADTGYWDFNPFDGSPVSGKLAHIVDRNGNTMSLGYDSTGRLTQIVDDLGRTNTVGYNVDGRISGVTDFSGRTVTYQYYQGLAADKGGAGDLASVTSPPVVGTPNGNDFPSGKVTMYTYTKGYPPGLEPQNHLLLSVVDALGQTTAQFSYDLDSASTSYLCCVSMQRWTNTPAMISYLPQTPSATNQFTTLRCVVNDSVGDVCECFYDARGRCVKLDEFTGRATPGAPVTATVNRPTGKLRADDPDYFECRATWNNDSLCSKLYLFGGQQWECVYQSDFDKSTQARRRAEIRWLQERVSSGVDLDGDGQTDTTERSWYYEHDPRFGSDPGTDGGRSVGMGMGKAMYSWMKDSFDHRYARGPRQTVSLDGNFASGEFKDRMGRPAVNTALNRMVTDGDDLDRDLWPDASLAEAVANVRWGFCNNPPSPSFKSGGVRWGFCSSLPSSASESSAVRWGFCNNPPVVSKSEAAIKAAALAGQQAAQSERIRFRARFPLVDNNLFSPGFVTSATDPRGNTTTTTFDAKGNPTYRSRSSIKFGYVYWAASMAHNPYGQPTTITNAPDANGYTRVDTFDYYTNGPQAGYLRVATIDDRSLLGLRLATTYEYDSRGNMTRCIDPRTNDWLYTYNALDQCVRVQSPVNITKRRGTDFYFDANDNLVQCTTELRDAADTFVTSKTDYFHCDPLHRLSRIECAVDAAHSMTNDFVYDGNDRCVLALGGDAVSGADPHQTVSFQYDERGLLFQEIGAPGSTGSVTNGFDYTANGKIKRFYCELYVEKMTFDDFDRPASIQDPMGNQTTFNFDASDNLKVVRRFGEMTDVPGTNGNIRLAESRYEFDLLDRCFRTHDLFFDPPTQAPTGDGESTTTFAYAPNDECISVTDDLGHVTSYTYDTVGWPASVSTPSTRTTFAVLRDRMGNGTSSTQTDISDLGGSPQVFARTNVYDSLNRCVSTTDNVGNRSHYGYDSLGRCTVLFNPKEYSVSRAYDLLGRSTLVVADLDGDGFFDLTHDITSSTVWSSSSDQLLATIDGHGNTTSYSYDSLSRCTLVTQADGTHCSLVWSPRSNLIQETDANGTVIVHTYDLCDRCTSNNVVPGAGVSSATTFEQFAFDGCSRLVSASNDGSTCTFAYDSLDNCTRGISGGLGALATFNGVGDRLSLTYPGGRALTYAYDSQDRCTNIVESGASLLSFDYDGPDRVARISYANGMRSRIFYDGISGTPNASGDFGHGQVSHIRHAMTGGSPVVSDVVLGWDRNGNKTARTDTIFQPAVPRTNSMTLTYDAADRLTEVTVLGGPVLLRDTAYGLDRMGNRTNVTGSATCPGAYTLSSAVPPGDFQMNQYTATPCEARSYDDNGNLVSRTAGALSVLTYAYDCHDQLASVSNSGSLVAVYGYDAVGRRISKTVFDSGGLPPLTTQFYYDGDSVIEERVRGAVTATYARPPHCFGAGQPKPQTCNMQRNGKDYFFHTDDQGNPLALTTAGGAVEERYDFDDYGAVTFLTSDGLPSSAASSLVGNPFLFQGMEWDAETGFYHGDPMETRTVVYMPTLGKSGKPTRAKMYLDPTAGRTINRCYDGTCAFADNSPWSAGRVVRKMIPITAPDITGAERTVSVNGSGAGSSDGLSPASANVVKGCWIGLDASGADPISLSFSKIPAGFTAKKVNGQLAGKK